MAKESEQKVTTWSPTPKQSDLLNALRRPGLKRSITSICNAAGVSRESFYRWREEDPGFRAAWSKAWEDVLDAHWPAITGAIVKQALEGKAPQQRLAAELRGVLSKRIELTGKDGGPVRTFDMRKMTDAQLDALIALDPTLVKHDDGDGG